MDNAIKKFKCEKCQKMKDMITWKVSKSDLFMCDNCWRREDINYKLEILEKIIQLNLNKIEIES